MPNVTHLIDASAAGDCNAAEELLPLVYNELRALAAARLAAAAPGQTLQATPLVHEAYLRLVGEDAEQSWKSRGHFFLAAAEAMRRILIDKARRKKRSKHIGGRQRFDLDNSDPPERCEDQEQVLAVDEALQCRGQQEPQVAEVVRLRWFAGLSVEQSAAALDICVRIANRHWAYARVWLYQEMKPDNDG